MTLDNHVNCVAISKLDTSEFKFVSEILWNRKQYVKVGEHLSEALPVERVVPQGATYCDPDRICKRVYVFKRQHVDQKY